MEIHNIDHIGNAQVNEKTKLNTKLIKVFTNYIRTMSIWMFHDSDCNCTPNKFHVGRMIHK